MVGRDVKNFSGDSKRSSSSNIQLSTTEGDVEKASGDSKKSWWSDIHPLTAGKDVKETSPETQRQRTRKTQ